MASQIVYGKNHSHLDHDGGFQPVSPQPQLQLDPCAASMNVCFPVGEVWLAVFHSDATVPS